MTRPISDGERERFDALVEEVIAALPTAFADFLEEIPLVVLDEPTPDILDDLEKWEGSRPDPADLCGLHTGIANTDANIEDSATTPSQIHIFRRGLIESAGGWDAPDADDAIADQIEITLLHEIGHQMGLDEDELDELGYG